MTDDLATRMPLAPRDLSEARHAARARFNEMFHEHLRAAARSGVTLVSSWAARLGVSEQYVRRNGDPLHTTGVLAAGDLDALDPADLIAFLERWLDRVRERVAPTPPARDPALFVLASASRTGRLATRVEYAVSDRSHGGKRITAREWREIARDLEEQERDARESKLAAISAAEAADREGL